MLDFSELFIIIYVHVTFTTFFLSLFLTGIYSKLKKLKKLIEGSGVPIKLFLQHLNYLKNARPQFFLFAFELQILN